MKYLSVLILAGLLLASVSCSTDPEALPKFRVRNDRATDASLQVKTSGGNTININNVQPGTTSAYQEVAKGQIDITLTIQGESGDFTGSFLALTNQTYTVVVANTTPPSVNIVSP